MAYLAPGHKRRTASAITCAVECRRNSRPASLSAVTMATWSPSCNRVSKSTSRPSTTATTAALASLEPISRANPPAVVPSASSLTEPSGRPTEMTPGIVHPFVQPETRATPGPDTDVIIQGYLTQFLFQAAPPPHRTQPRGVTA